MTINTVNSRRKVHKEGKSQKPKSKPYNKKVLLISIIIAIISITIAVFVIIVKSQPSKLSNAYDKCKGEFTALEAEAEETNNKREDATIYFKSGTPKETLESMASIMNTFGKVKSVEVSTSEEEYQKFLDENKDNEEMRKTLEDGEMRELLRSSIEAVMHIKAYDYNDLSSIKYVVNNNPTFRENISTGREPVYNTTSPVGFGTIELFDNGNTIVMETEGDDYADKLNCVCSALEMPYRIRDAIGQTAMIDRTRQDEWDNFKIEWSYSASNKKLHIVISQK